MNEGETKIRGGWVVSEKCRKKFDKIRQLLNLNEI